MAKVAEDAANLVKESALTELRGAVTAVRALAVSDKQTGEEMKAAKLRVAAAIKGATEAGCSQDEIVAASAAVAPPAPAQHAAPDGSTDGSVQGAPPTGEPAKKEPFTSDVKDDGQDVPRRVKPKDAARQAATTAKEAGKTPAEIAKAAAAAAKAAGGSARDIAKAAMVAAKIAGVSSGQASEDSESESSSSSSESSSDDVEAEAPIEAKAKAAAKRDGIAAAFYFAAHAGVAPAT